MINLRYIKFVVLSLCASGICAMLWIPSQPDASGLVIALTSTLTVPFVSLVIVRLPVFNKFYRRKSIIHIIDTNTGYPDASDSRAAPVLVSFVTGAVIALALWLLALPNITLPAFCGAVTAFTLSFYHEP